ncbi:MAG: hypothetical protein AMJ62_11105 [Myxococcales bacterium SG8_38]|nr:MAG: hypothetical protein AMJ62_11105 [Myxococcales bacterium SG8_38]
MRIGTLVVALALMGGALESGCVEDVRFNPSGCDVHVRGRWLVDGQNPTAETCGNIGLVELAIIDEPELQFWIPPEFSLRCDAQSDPNAAVIDGGAYIDTMIVTRDRCGGSGQILDEPPSSNSSWIAPQSRRTPFNPSTAAPNCSWTLARCAFRPETGVSSAPNPDPLRTGPRVARQRACFDFPHSPLW